MKTCPICGKPVPAQKGKKPRKFCSRKCADVSARIAAIHRGYKKPKCHERVCKFCGLVFFSDDSRRSFCSRECANHARSRVPNVATKIARVKSILDQRERNRIALDNCRETAPVTVEERDGKVIEWRGQRRIGCRAADHVRHS